MNRQLTVTSAAEYNRVLYGQMSPAMAVASPSGQPAACPYFQRCPSSNVYRR